MIRIRQHPPMALDDRASRGRRSISAVAGLLGAALLLAYAPQMSEVLKARRWPTVAGRISDQTTSNELSYVYVGKYQTHDVMMSRLRVSYEFVFRGQTYSGTAISPVQSWVADSKANRERFATGNSVMVHVNPREPADAVLDVPFPWGPLAGTLVGGLGVLWAIRTAWLSGRTFTWRRAAEA